MRLVHSSAADRATPRGRDVQLVHERFEPVVGLRDGVGVEPVGLDDVGARLEVFVVDAANDVGAREDEQIVVPLEIARVPAQSLAAKVRFGRRVPLDHRPHRAIEDQDPVREQLVELLSNGHFCFLAGSLVFVMFSWLRGGTWFRAGGDEHREGIPGLARADADAHVPKPGRRQQPRQLLVAEAERLVAELGPHPLFRVRSEIEDQDTTARNRDPRGLDDGARRDPAAWCSACDSSATSTLSSFTGSFSSSPRFQMTFETRRRRASPLARSSTTADRSTAMTRAAQRDASIVR